MRVVETYTTPNGKDIEIFIPDGTGHYKVQFKAGGQLPAELTGSFTSVAIAKVAVDSYLIVNKDKFEKRAENKKLEKEIKKELTESKED